MQRSPHYPFLVSEVLLDTNQSFMLCIYSENTRTHPILFGTILACDFLIIEKSEIAPILFGAILVCDCLNCVIVNNYIKLMERRNK